MDRQAVRLHFLLDLSQDGVQAGGDGLGGHHHGHIVNAVGHIVHGDVVALQDGEDLPQHANLVAHAPLGQGDDGEVLLAGNAGDEPVRIGVALKALLDHGAGILRGVGIADVQRDVLLPHGEDGALVKHLGPGIAQLPELVVGDLGDGLGIVYDPGVRHQDTGDVGPVFIDVGIQGRSGQGAGDIAAASRKGLDLAIGQLTVESGDHHTNAVHLIAQSLVAGLLVHGAVEAELDPVCRIHEFEAQIVCHKPGGEVFAPAGQLVLGYGLIVQLGLQVRKLRLQIDGEV